MKITIQRSYYRHGQIREEVPLSAGVPHGIVRHWHPNGVLASREPHRKGVLHGLVRHWNESGKLMGEFRMVHGTGVHCTWHENGHLKSEISMVEGFPCGRARLWLPDGRLQRECFYVDLISLSPAAYARAQKLDPTLPQYPELNRKGYRQKRRISERHLEDLFIRSLLEEPGIVEARRWLDHEGKKPGLKYSLGRFSSRRAALKFVEAAYGAGATRVWVPKTLLDKQGNKFADVLLVGLPTDPKARRKLRAVCGIVLTKVLGSITPKKDRGEKWILIGMW